MTLSKLAAISPFLAFFGAWVYLAFLDHIGDPRMKDGALSGADMNWVEWLLLLYATVGILSLWLRTMWRTVSAKRYGWAMACLICWPLAAVYLWREKKVPIQSATDQRP